MARSPVDTWFTLSWSPNWRTALIVSTPDDGRRGGRSGGLGDHMGAPGELWKLKPTHRAIPKHAACR